MTPLIQSIRAHLTRASNLVGDALTVLESEAIILSDVAGVIGNVNELTAILYRIVQIHKTLEIFEKNPPRDDQPLIALYNQIQDIVNTITPTAAPSSPLPRNIDLDDPTAPPPPPPLPTSLPDPQAPLRRLAPLPGYPFNPPVECRTIRNSSFSLIPVSTATDEPGASASASALSPKLTLPEFYKRFDVPPPPPPLPDPPLAAFQPVNARNYFAGIRRIAALHPRPGVPVETVLTSALEFLHTFLADVGARLARVLYFIGNRPSLQSLAEAVAPFYPDSHYLRAPT